MKLKTHSGRVGGIHVCFCITHTFEFMTAQFFDTMLGLQTKYSYTLMRSNMLPIERNRTHLVNLAMQDPTVSHCMFLDTDIVPKDPDFLDILVSYDLPIVGLLCTKKIPPYEPVIYKQDVPEEEKLNGFWTGYPKGLVEVDAIGTGCLLVKREVFQKIPQPYFRFVSSYTNGLYQSEDIYFIENAKKAGFKTYVDTEHTCLHYGVRGFGVEDFERERGEKCKI